MIGASMKLLLLLVFSLMVVRLRLILLLGLVGLVVRLKLVVLMGLVLLLCLDRMELDPL